MNRLALALFLLALPAAAQAAPLPFGTYTFSDFCAGPEPWEVHGHRVELYHLHNGNFLTTEFSDGGFDSDPVHATPVRLDPDTGTLWYSYQDYNDDYQFQGTVTPQSISGSFDDDQSYHSLPRVPNSWPELPPCGARPTPAAPPK